MCKHVLLWSSSLSLNHIVQLQLVGFQEKDTNFIQKWRKKMDMLVWRAVVKYLRKLEECRIQSSLQVGKKKKTSEMISRTII